MAPIKTILHLTPFFSPNIGGVETHLDDLTRGLQSKNYNQIVLTYSPLTTHTTYQKVEKSNNLYIRRFYLPGHNLFHRFEKHPLINFLYITPYLLFRSCLWLLLHHPHIDTIHSHGLNAAQIGNVVKKIFCIPRHIVSIYSTYDNVPLNSLSTKLLVHILRQTDHVLTQTNQSVHQLIKLGIPSTQISRYYHWINLQQFHPIQKPSQAFTALFVGRLIPTKNALLLAQLAPEFPKIIFKFVGTGPDYPSLSQLAHSHKNIILVGDVPYSQLHQYYQNADIFCLPSKYHEGWGRVLAESIACGTPVICSNLGGTTEAVDNSVAIIVSPTADNFHKAIKKIFADPTQLQKLKKNCPPYAKKYYSSDNILYITRHY